VQVRVWADVYVGPTIDEEEANAQVAEAQPQQDIAAEPGEVTHRQPLENRFSSRLLSELRSIGNEELRHAYIPPSCRT
jgi:hypothetical protein